MKRFKNIVIGGIETKVFNLILATVILLAAAFVAVSQYHSSMLAKLAADSSERQQTAIQEITDSVMDSVADGFMEQTTTLEAEITDEMFRELETRVEMMGRYAEKLFSDPGFYPRSPFAGPDPRKNGTITTQLILAKNVSDRDPVVADRIGLAANMSDLMSSLYAVSKETNSCFIALPNGAFLVTDDRSGAKYDSVGVPIRYDARTRPWYQQAVDQKELIFTDVEVDAFTGDIGIVCAMPVYVSNRLAAVVGSDLFLTSMREKIQASDAQGGFLCVVNQKGHVVFSPKTEGVFRAVDASKASDLRRSDNPELAALVNDALEGQTDMRLVELEDGAYYMMGAPMKTVGWAMLSVCSQEIISQPTTMLRASYAEIQEETTAAYRNKMNLSRTTTLVLLGAVILLMLAAALTIGKRIVTPLNTITERIANLREGDMEFKMEDAYRTGDEIEVLAQSFADISHKTVVYVDTVRKVTAEKERIGAELSLANTIQGAMLPHIFPAFPDRPDFDIYAGMDPAKQVGGDFYDYFLIDDDHLCMVIADVSGKGVPAALFMMASKIILQSVAMLGRAPAEILAKTNEAICSNNEAEMFVTVWLGILELSTGKLTAANAGHEYPMLKRPGGPYELYRDKHGFVIGGLNGAVYREYELTLEPGTKLFVYTDGLPEASNGKNEFFGIERTLSALNARPEAGPEEVLANIRKAVDDFRGDAEPFDDLTMLCLEYKGGAPKGDEPE